MQPHPPAHPSPPSRPDRRAFEIAVICALPLEADAVDALFDRHWDDGPSYKAPGDPNAYSTGALGRHNVVLAHMPGMGTTSAATVAARCSISFPNICLALVVGICGGVPFGPDGREIVLGDVIVSDGVVQYDFGRMLPDRFSRKDTLLDSLGRPNAEIRALLAKLRGLHGRKTMQQKTARYLDALRQEPELAADYPGTARDRLFEASYMHASQDASCEQIGCNGNLVPRVRLASGGTDFRPAIHFGLMASGNTVMKSGENRDEIARSEGIVAFEMESAGVWDIFPCVVIKGVCDYADSHKDKAWQRYAAAAAASCAKAFLDYWVPSSQKETGKDVHLEETLQSRWVVPFGRNKDFVGRESILAELLSRIPPSADPDDCQRTAIEGLGGVGKTQIALEAAFRVRDEHADCSVFWVPAVDVSSFENAYREIGRELRVQGIDENKADVKALVKAALSRDAGRWLLIIDNADDMDLFFGPTGLSDYLPFSKNGSILFTTRNHEAAVRLDIPERGIITTAEISRSEAIELLQRNLKENQTRDTASTTSLIDFLAYLPLAIKQASAYMAKTGMTTTKYLDHCRSSDKTMTKLLSKDFEDRGRYKSIKNAVATTWLISFEHISRSPLATQYLRFMCFLGEKDIPASLLPAADDELEADEAIGTLKAYAFISQREEQDSFDMHRLVRLAMRNWVNEKGEKGELVTKVIGRVAEEFPFPEHENRDVWMRYLPHAQAALEFRGDSTNEEDESRLLFNVGNSFNILGKYREAEEIYRQALKGYEKVVGRGHPRTLASMNNLAEVLRHQGKYKEAEEMHRQTLELMEKVLGREHPSTLSSMNNLALVLDSQGKYEKAEEMHRQTLELRENLI